MVVSFRGGVSAILYPHEAFRFNAPIKKGG